MKKISILLILILIASGCASKKTITEYKDRIVNDTIIKTKTEVLVERFTDTLTIEQPCDSLGNLRPFKQLISTKQGNILLEGKNNLITSQIDLKAYKEVLEKEYKSKSYKNIVVKEKEVIRYRTPLWLILLCPILFGFGYLIGKFS
jgi:PBP1b-binding outer membrane lipoprotein LpoB